MSLIVSNSSAAFAHIKFASLVISSYVDIAIPFPINSAFFTISAIMLKLAKSLWNHFFTLIISTPHLRKYAAASNVLTPVLNVKFFVSSLFLHISFLLQLFLSLFLLLHIVIILLLILQLMTHILLETLVLHFL